MNRWSGGNGTGTLFRPLVALDGKALRRALRLGESVRQVFSVWAPEAGLTLGQRQVEDKSKESTVVPELLRALDVAGCIVTADALYHQKRLAREIVEVDAQDVSASVVVVHWLATRTDSWLR